MSEYHLALLIAASVAMLASYKTPRAIWWVLGLAASFVVSVAYLYMAKPYIYGFWWPPASGVAMLCDAILFLVIREFSKDKWERWLGALIMLSVTINLVYSTGHIFGFPPIPSRELYAIGLEVINYLALITIAGTGILDRLGSRNGHSVLGISLGGIHSASQSIHKKATYQSWVTKW